MKQQKIAIIGPSLRHRGGIARHTVALAHEISKTYEIKIFSYKRIFPKWLYPGTSIDLDLSSEIHQKDQSEYILDSLSPASWLRLIQMLKKYHPDKIIIQWWHFSLFFVTVSIVLAMRKKSKIVLMCHNAKMHEKSLFSEFLSKVIWQLSDRILVHSKPDFDFINRVVSEDRIRFYNHPAYIPDTKLCKPPNNSQKKRLLFFGLIRPYKGVDLLLEAIDIFEKRNGPDKLEVNIVGENWIKGGHSEFEKKNKNLATKINIVNQYIQDEEVESYFENADLVVLPYQSASGSGVIALSYGYGKPVLVTNVGGLPDQVIDGVSGFICEPSALSIANAISRFVDSNKRWDAERLRKTAIELYSWSSLIDNMLE